jgi:hypothetical protein
MRLAAIALGVGLIVWLGWRFGLPWIYSAHAPTPVDLTAEPVQEPLVPPEQVVVTRGERKFTLLKTHRYVVSGEVLSATSYDLAWTNDFFDVDVGLLWGTRREEFKDRFKFFQMGRFLFWRTDQPVTDTDRVEVNRHISNNHLIPAEGHGHIASAARWVSKGDQVRIEGALVQVLDDSGRALATSSTSRDDTGEGACEIIWVDSLQINGRIFR